MDAKCGLTVDERKEKLLKVLADSIKVVGKLFGYMIKILKDEDTVLADNAAETLLKKYTDYAKWLLNITGTIIILELFFTFYEFCKL